jgi:hypothetical protein
VIHTDGMESKKKKRRRREPWNGYGSAVHLQWAREKHEKLAQVPRTLSSSCWAVCLASAYAGGKSINGAEGYTYTYTQAGSLSLSLSLSATLFFPSPDMRIEWYNK